MPLLPIVLHPDKILRNESVAVTDINDEIRSLFANMRETMLLSRGIGLAAPQVGVCQRLIVVDTSEKRDQPIALANPRIIRYAGEIESEEGCLSVPGVRATVRRAEYITVTGLNADGNEVSFDAEAMQAICIQHEIDHLDGVLFFDHLSFLKRIRLLAKYDKLRDK